MEFIFGNVNERGELEDSSELDPSLVASLKSDYLSSVLGTSFAGIYSADPLEFQEKDSNAQDFSEIQELADDFSIELPSVYEPPAPILEKPVKKPFIDESLNKIKQDISKGKIEFTSIFGPLTREIVKTHAPKKISFFQDHGFKLGKDDRSAFNTVNEDQNLINLYTELKKERVSTDKKIVELDREVVDRNIDDCFMPIEIDNWENRISRVPSGKKMGLFRNHILDSGEWLDAVVEDEFSVALRMGDLDDPMIVFDTSKTVPPKPAQRNFLGKDGKPLDKFNISNDWVYETIRNHKTDRVRQVVGPTKLEHAHCAIRLHFQYYKPNLTTKELRNWHRPPFKFPLHQDIKVSRVKAFKKKKAKGRDPSELLKSSKNISLRDSCQYLLLEYSEEYPLIMQNQGMASMIYNYYRKKDEKDSYAPRMPNGAAYILEQVDSSPFFCFGEIYPGQTIQAIYNNLFRAPIFKHPVPETDFLLIRSTYKGKSKYYIREIPNIYVVGQCFPIQEIPPPSSRKLVHTIKGRVQAIAYRYMQRDPLRRLKYSLLAKVFNFYSEAEIRNKIKEYLVYAKKGENTGWWKLNPKLTFPNEEGIRKIITPEMACLMESSLVGQQRLNDAGYGSLLLNDNEEGINEDEDATLDMEIRMAPWTGSKNFFLAAQGKGMIALYGPGDPTGCGEAFSFVRASMKEMFFMEGHSDATKAAFLGEKARTTYHRFSIIDQQQVYKSEIKRIWNNQLRSLTAISQDKKGNTKSRYGPKIDRDEITDQRFDVSSPMTNSKDPETASDNDDTQSNATSNFLSGKNKILVINRLVRNANSGELEWISELITDMRIMSAYLRQRTLIERNVTQESTEPLSLEESKVRRRNKIAEHLANLRLNRKGKRKFVEGTDNNNEALGLVTVKLPMHTIEAAKKRKADEELAAKKLVLKQKPAGVELNALFDKLIKEIMGLEEAWPFCKPLSKEIYPDYYDVIKNPKTLQDIQNDVTEKKFKSCQEFLSDLKLISYNCRLYNGDHPITNIADGLVSKAEQFIESNKEDIEILESSLLEESQTGDKQDSQPNSMILDSLQDSVSEKDPPQPL